MPKIKYIANENTNNSFAKRNDQLKKDIRKALIDADVTMGELATHLKITPKTLHQRLVKGTLTIQNLYIIESFLGIHLFDGGTA